MHRQGGPNQRAITATQLQEVNGNDRVKRALKYAPAHSKGHKQRKVPDRAMSPPACVDLMCRGTICGLRLLRV